MIGAGLPTQARRFLLIQGASYASSRATFFSLPWLLLERGYSASFVGLLLGVILATYALAGTVFVGAVGRFTAMSLVTLSDFARAILTLMLAGLVLSSAPIVAFLAPAALLGIFNLAGTAGREAMTGELVPTDDTSLVFQYTSLAQGARDFATGVGPLVAGLLIANQLALLVFVVDAATYLASAVLVARMGSSRGRLTSMERATPGRIGLSRVWTFVRGSPRILLVVVQSAFTNLLMGPMMGLILLALAQELEVSAASVGAALGAFGVGGILGSILAERYNSRLSNFGYYGLWLLTIGLCMTIIATVRVPVVWILAMLIAGICNLLLNSLGDAMFTVQSAPELRVALFGFLAAVFRSLEPIGQGVAGIVVERWDARAAFSTYMLVLLIVACLTCVAVWRTSYGRGAERVVETR